MDPTAPPSLNEALGRLWVQFLPQMLERVDALESAGDALAAGSLTNDQRAAANSAAHKLAGVLGTFGLTKGTILARETEILYSGEPETDPAASARLLQIAEQLKTMIVAHK